MLHTTQDALRSGMHHEHAWVRLPGREKKEYEGLEAKIDALAKQKAEMEVRLAGAGSDYALMAELSAELSSIAEEIDHKTERWLELAEIAEVAQV
jgi:ATP-binding cassette subfamily F protein uup